MIQIDDIVTSLKLRPGTSNLSEELLKDLIKDTIIDVKECCNIPEDLDLPLTCISIVKDIVVIKANKLGSEGLSSESYSGISQSYLDDLPKYIKRKIIRKRKLPR